jgi:hypothetical protein
MGLLATMAALVLGLLIASEKTAFDTRSAEVRQSATSTLLLDRTLAEYGPETRGIRDLLRQTVMARLAVTWPDDPSVPTRLDANATTSTIEGVEHEIRALVPQNEIQRGVQARALQNIGDLLQTRWLFLGDVGESLPLPFLVVLVFWLTVLFASFGLLAPRNATVVAVLVVCAFSVSTSIYLIVELDHPFSGLMRVSSAPLRYALSHLGE